MFDFDWIEIRGVMVSSRCEFECARERWIRLRSDRPGWRSRWVKQNRNSAAENDRKCKLMDSSSGNFGWEILRRRVLGFLMDGGKLGNFLS